MGKRILAIEVGETSFPVRYYLKHEQTGNLLFHVSPVQMQLPRNLHFFFISRAMLYARSSATFAEDAITST